MSILRQFVLRQERAVQYVLGLMSLEQLTALSLLLERGSFQGTSYVFPEKGAGGTPISQTKLDSANAWVMGVPSGAPNNNPNALKFRAWVEETLAGKQLIAA